MIPLLSRRVRAKEARASLRTSLRGKDRDMVRVRVSSKTEALLSCRRTTRADRRVRDKADLKVRVRIRIRVRADPRARDKARGRDRADLSRVEAAVAVAEADSDRRRYYV